MLPVSRIPWLLSALLLCGCKAINASVIPEQVPIEQLHVPFTSQAPHANWDDPYQEACEEASALMVSEYYKGNVVDIINADEADYKLTLFMDVQNARGYPEDITLEQLGDISRIHFGLEQTIIDDPTIEDIETAINEGIPVIVPAAGRELQNPYFSGEGPWYHMLVITGYNDTHFITNDPGTKRGRSYPYKKEVLMNAIHDWTGVKEEIGTGDKKVLLLERQ